MSELTSEANAGAAPRRGRPRSVGLAERRRAELTEAAFSVFAEQGYEKASVGDIAKRAGMGQGTLYRYVDGKRELLDLVFDMCVDELMTAISPDDMFDVTTTGEFTEAGKIVSELGDRLYALVDGRPELLKVLLVQAGTVDEELRYRIQGLYQTFDGMAGRALEHARERDWVRTRTADPVAESRVLGRLLPTLALPGFILALTGEDDQREAFVASAATMVRRGILSDSAREGANR
ncbi:TetR/AcrR family transcriptional regulator [Tsukamurella ocularis]|uniref:TetR/AcrR family transcriptional regulator n=1 Tax=Tsukamurella ocularis TaxID=1970234 RepID=UPI0021674D8F|nr:TetR/AcrR family transcriptional regulator [Tsukamurella ocularis]MCS3778804.1 AcrR family transcriptional regulator [Tsukamurella ocularis]MCS3787576.1 AcrR family transcriptional regulator [Tsukamurella ocularis]MCS3851487.1 AcrR family transcriptional regulator [Tsukamurella ocularis]